jgi:hypothetical protein
MLELPTAFLTALRRGRYIETAADVAGIGPSTVRTWLRLGRGARRCAAQGDMGRDWPSGVCASEWLRIGQGFGLEPGPCLPWSRPLPLLLEYLPAAKS